MSMNELPRQWANRFGLALAPLFGTKEMENEDSHAVLLDGGNASFAMSVTPEELWLDKDPACWAWSSNLPHHVTVTDRVVAVTRWDNPNSEVLSRSSVESKIELFYEYLANNHVRSNQRVVEYVLNLFRRIRSLVAKTELQDEQSIDVLLAILAQDIESEWYVVSGEEPIAPLITGTSVDLLRMLPDDGINSLIEELRDGTPFRSFRLYPSLAVRHAGSEIFQEAHFELLRAPSPDLFNYIGPAESNSVTRGGAHFTPPALARCLVEQTLLQIEDLENRERLIVLDPACGSGSFLHEALRALQRHNFSGHIKLVGRDISPAAVSMANFVVRHGAMDWSSKRNIEIDVLVADSLVDPLPHADVVLMNPPFISWQSLDNFQRDQMRQVLGSLHKRPR